MNVQILPAYLPLEGKYHLFQKQMSDVDCWKSDTLLVDAPTGSGKTYGFIQLAKKQQGRLLVVEPTTKLCRQLADDLEKEGFSPAIIDSKRITSEREPGENKLSTIKKMVKLAREDVVITNPVQLSFLIYNYYKGSKEDRVLFLRRAFPLVAIDEWHAFNTHQMALILSIHYIMKLNDNAKFVYTSATPPFDAQDILKLAGIETELLPVEFGDTHGRKIRGHVTLSLYEGCCLNWVKEKENMEKLADKRWILIFDRIRDLAQALELISAKYPGDVTPLTGFHRRSAHFPDPDTYNWEHRIVLATNILELGVNPPTSKNKKYTRMVLDPGFSWQNTIQRFGRMGRNGIDAEIYLCNEGVIQLYPLQCLKDLETKKEITYRDFQKWCINSQHNVFFPELNCRRVGIQLGVMLDRFEQWNLKKSVRETIIDECLRGGIKIVEKAKIGIEKFPKDQYMQRASYIDEWWNDYMDSLSMFIKPEEKAKINFESMEEEFVTMYGALWIHRNMIRKENIWKFRKKDNLDFHVYVTGIPFKEKALLPAERYLYQAREEIREAFFSQLKDDEGFEMFLGKNALQKLRKALEPLIMNTASKDRLNIIEVIDDSQTIL